MKRSQVLYKKSLGNLAPLKKQLNVDRLVAIVDRKLRSKMASDWRGVDQVIFVSAGEELKSLESVAQLAARLQKIHQRDPGRMALVAVGGGSLGDFVGFVASIYQRGIPLVHIPSTFLAMVDSAHGGKTGVNLNSVKNQLGSFYPAKQIWICRDLLESLPSKHWREGAAELIKVALLSGGRLFKTLQGQPLSKERIWRALPEAIEFKYKTVAKDPFETNGHRRILNFGHTVGHIFETQYDISHGRAVGLGMEFSLLWSYELRLLSEQSLRRMLTLLPHQMRQQSLLKSKSVDSGAAKGRRPLKVSPFLKALSLDKKMVRADQLEFIFLQGLGRPLRKKIKLEQVLKEAQRQGWVK